MDTDPSERLLGKTIAFWYQQHQPRVHAELTPLDFQWQAWILARTFAALKSDPLM
jgi:hypothetical protein